MLYIRNIFTQDLREGKQIAFPTEPSNLIFQFDFSIPDPDRQISFKYKEKDNTSPFFLHNNKTINTRLYSSRSEARIDGDLKQFLRDVLMAKVDDVIVFRPISQVLYEFEFFPVGTKLHKAYKEILNSKNHEVILDQVNNQDNDLFKSDKIREFAFGVFKFLQNEFGDAFLLETSAIAKRKLFETDYEAFIFPDYFRNLPILGSFTEEQSEVSLKTSNTLRYFSENLKILGQEYIYFTTQWGFPEFQKSSSFISFNQFVLDYSKNKYRIEYDDLSKYYKLILNFPLKEILQIGFNLNSFQIKAKEAGLIFSTQLINRFVASLWTKPFVICSGLSGSGKTKLAQAFAQWITADKLQYEIVPVGADWTNREPILGYPNALDKEDYVSPENGVLNLLIRARNEYDIYLADETKIPKPYFLILDEMNLSHVERYFADFLSTMESGDKIPLHKIENDSLIVPPSIKLPKNLFIVGTVNIDETTYMFSPKVLDRANTIEFRLTEKDLAGFIESDLKLDMDLLKAQGANMSDGFIKMALQETDKNLKPSETDLKLFFSELKKSGAEFGYRTASEIGRLMYMLKELGESGDNLLDIAIMQKLLPKLHGSRSKLNTALTTLAKFCVKDAVKDFDGKDEDFRKTYFIPFDKLPTDSLDKIKYKISFEKISRMHKNAMENGFTSYAEA